MTPLTPDELRAQDELNEWAARLPGREWTVAPNPTRHRARKLDFVAATYSHGRQLHVAAGRSPGRAMVDLAWAVARLSH